MEISNSSNKYFWWLRYYGGVNFDPDRKYGLLFQRLYTKPFMVKLPNDSNRVYEALEIRNEYRTYELNTDQERYVFDNSHNIKSENIVCFLELLISLAIRGDDVTDDPNKDVFFWFWNMLGSAGLAIMSDDVYRSRGGDLYIDGILENINRRTFERNGKGSFFPIHKTRIDQRKIELWYQMCGMIEYEGW